MTYKDVSEARRARDTKLIAEVQEVFKDHTIHSETNARWTIARHYEDGHMKSDFWVEIVVLGGGSLLIHGDIGPIIFSSYSGSIDRPLNPLNVVRWVGCKSGVSYYLQGKARIGEGCPTCSTADCFKSEIARLECDDQLKEAIEHCAFTWIEDGEGLSIPQPWEAQLVNKTLVGDTALTDAESSMSEEEPIPATVDGYLCHLGFTAETLTEKVHEVIDNDEIVQVWREIPDFLYDVGGNSDSSVGFAFNSALAEALYTAGEEDVSEIVGEIGIEPSARLYYCWGAVVRLVQLLDERDVAGTKLLTDAQENGTKEQ